MNKLLFLLFTILLSAYSVESQTILAGQVRDVQEALVGATVKVSKAGTIVRGVITDVEGNYRMSVDSGSYEVEVSYTGYAIAKFKQIEVLLGKLNLLDVTLTSGFEAQEPEIYSCHFGPPIFPKDGTEDGQTFTADQIRHIY